MCLPDLRRAHRAGDTRTHTRTHPSRHTLQEFTDWTYQIWVVSGDKMHKAEESKAAPQVSAASLQVHQGSQARQRLRHGVSLSEQQDVAQA